MATYDAWKFLLRDYVTSVLTDAVELKSLSHPDDNFAAGQRTAYYDCLDRLKQLADACGLEQAEIGLDGLDLEDKLL